MGRRRQKRSSKRQYDTVVSDRSYDEEEGESSVVETDDDVFLDNDKSEDDDEQGAFLSESFRQAVVSAHAQTSSTTVTSSRSSRRDKNKRTDSDKSGKSNYTRMDSDRSRKASKQIGDITSRNSLAQAAKYATGKSSRRSKHRRAESKRSYIKDEKGGRVETDDDVFLSHSLGDDGDSKAAKYATGKSSRRRKHRRTVSDRSCINNEEGRGCRVETDDDVFLPHSLGDDGDKSEDEDEDEQGAFLSESFRQAVVSANAQTRITTANPSRSSWRDKNKRTDNDKSEKSNYTRMDSDRSRKASKQIDDITSTNDRSLAQAAKCATGKSSRRSKHRRAESKRSYIDDEEGGRVETDDDVFLPHSLGDDGKSPAAKYATGKSSRRSKHRRTDSKRTDRVGNIPPPRPSLGSTRTSSSRSAGLGLDSKDSSRRSGFSNRSGSNRTSSSKNYSSDRNDDEKRRRRLARGRSSRREGEQQHGESSNELGSKRYNFFDSSTTDVRDECIPDIDEGPSHIITYEKRGHGLPKPPMIGAHYVCTDITSCFDTEKQKGKEGRKTKRLVIIILVAFVLVGAIMGVAGYCYYRYSGSSDDSTQVSDHPTAAPLHPPTPEMPITIVVHPAPYDIGELCSLANVARNGGEAAFFECSKACKAAECCYGNNADTGAVSCIDNDEVERENCLNYSPHCDILYGRMDRVESRMVGQPPKYLADTCNAHLIQSSEGARERCEAACRPGWCCFAPIFLQGGFVDNESLIDLLPHEMIENYAEAAECFEGNEDVCGGFSPCLVLTKDPEPLDNVPTSSPDAGRPSIPPPPENLPTLCSGASIKTAQGLIDCQASCFPGECCGSLDPDLSCFKSDEQTCALYGPCQALHDAAGADGAEGSPPPPPPPYLDRVCSFEIMGQRDEYRDMCENICRPGKCCMDGTCEGGGNEEDFEEGDACTPYESCQNLLPLPPPPSNLVELCSSDDPDNLNGCEEACLPAMCCLSSGSDSCFDYHDEMCSKYSACGALLQTDDGDRPATVPMPTSKTELSAKCSNSNIASSTTGLAECEEICEVASCCFSPEAGANCFTENEEVCGEWASCLVLFEEDEDEIVQPPPAR